MIGVKHNCQLAAVCLCCFKIWQIATSASYNRFNKHTKNVTMAKLTYKTKAPRKGYVHHESFMTHQTNSLRDKLPPSEIQYQAHQIVSEAMRDLIKKLEVLGYDQTRVGFYIHTKLF